ncbi:MAG: hypothetical protein AAFV93_09765 [Chloroflexota bacterium]
MSNRASRILFQLWAFIGLIVFGLMLLHESASSTFFGRYSTSYALSLGLVLMTIVLALVGWWLVARNQLTRLLPQSPLLAWLMTLLCLGFIGVFWLFAPGASFLPAIALFRVYIVTVAIGLTLFYLMETQTTLSQLPQWSWIVIVIVGIGITLALTITYIGQVPETRYYDEPLVANYGWTCAQDGIMGIDMLPPRDTPYLAFVVPIAYCAPGYLMQWFGTTLTVARSFGILIVWLAIPFIYMTAKQSYGLPEAIFASLIVMMFALSHNHLRSDPYVTFALAVALWGYIRSKDTPALWLHFIVGFFLATIIEGHQLGIRFIPIFVLLYLWDYVQAIRQQKRWLWHMPFFAFALGGLSYLPLYYWVHVIWWGQTDLLGTIELLQQGYDEQLTVGGDVTFWERIWDNTREWFLTYPVRHPAEVMLLTVGIITALWRRDKLDRLLLFVFGLSVVLYLYIAPKPTVYYWVHHLPLVALFGAGFLHRLRHSDNTSRTVMLIPILAVTIFQASHYIKAGQSTQNANQVMAIGFDIDIHLPDDIDTVTGHQVYFYGLADRTFYDSNTYAYLSVSEANAEYNINPLQAIIWTRGLDEHPSLADYIEAEAMVAVRCYTTNFFSRETVLYVLPQFVETIEQTGCN